MTRLPRFRHLAATTTALTFALILLGVYTAAIGAGLSCSAQWPLCDGGLLPQTFPSFVEWFHRLVAMITGFFILGTAIAAWRAHPENRRIKGAAALALVVTPLQVLLGGATVLAYTPVVQMAHHGAALVIFGALLATTIWAYEYPAESDPIADTNAEDGYPSGD